MLEAPCMPHCMGDEPRTADESWELESRPGHRAGEKAEEAVAIEEAGDLEARLRAEVEALRRELSAVLQRQHERLLELEAREWPGDPKAKEQEGEETTEPPAVITGDDLDVRDQEVEFGGSCWDACLLVGAPCLGIWGSLAVCLCTLLNIAVQTIFVALVFANFLESEFSTQDIDSFKAWRVMVAHDDRHTSEGGVSMAARVCGQDPTLELSNEQSRKLHLIRSYLPSLDPNLSNPEAFTKEWLKTVLDGSVMCLVAVLCWVLTVAKEVGSIFETLGAMLWLPSSRRLGVQVAEAPDGGSQIISAGAGSKAFMLLVLLLRLAAALALLVAGCLYLARTSSMQDLLLNAVALECVLCIDELIYEALAPRRARQVLKGLLPLRLPPWPRELRALDAKTIFLGGLLAGMLLLVGLLPLKEHVDNLQAAHSQLCGGLVDFASSMDSLMVVHTQRTNPFRRDEMLAGLGGHARDLAILERVAGTPMGDTRYSLDPQDYTFDSLDLLRTADILSTTSGMYALSANLGCHDALDLPLRNVSELHSVNQPYWPAYVHGRRVWLHYVRSLPRSNRTGQTCADFVHLCEDEQLVKAVCPSACGCDSMLRGGVVDMVNADCPTSCRRSIAASEKTAAACEDARPNDPGDPKWQRLVAYLKYFNSTYGWSAANASCEALHTGNGDLARTLCQPPEWLEASSPTRTSTSPAHTRVLKLITFACPVTCNCGGRGGPASSHLAPTEQQCPDRCECPREYSTVPQNNRSRCSVAHYVAGYSFAPVDVDAKCCSLMNEYSRLLSVAMTGGSANASEWVPLKRVICNPCYQQCLSTLWSLRVVDNGNWRFHSLYLLATTGSAQVNETMRDFMCPTIRQRLRRSA